MSRGPLNQSPEPPVTLATIAREWGRIGCIGFGGPPAHIALLRQLCVDRRGWLSAAEFEDAVAVDRALRVGAPASKRMRYQMFMHRDLKPLDQVDLRSDAELGQLDLFQNECEGMCGV